MLLLSAVRCSIQMYSSTTLPTSPLHFFSLPNYLFFVFFFFFFSSSASSNLTYMYGIVCYRNYGRDLISFHFYLSSFSYHYAFFTFSSSSSSSFFSQLFIVLEVLHKIVTVFRFEIFHSFFLQPYSTVSSSTLPFSLPPHVMFFIFTTIFFNSLFLDSYILNLARFSSYPSFHFLIICFRKYVFVMSSSSSPLHLYLFVLFYSS